MVLHLIKAIPIKRILTEDEPSRAGSKNSSFKAMCNIQIENHVKRENKLKENVKKSYTVIFKKFSPSQVQTIIQEQPKFDSILNCPLKIMYTIHWSMHELIHETYPYMSLTESLSRLINNMQQDKKDWWIKWRVLNKRRVS